MQKQLGEREYDLKMVLFVKYVEVTKNKQATWLLTGNNNKMITYETSQVKTIHKHTETQKSANTHKESLTNNPNHF